MMSGTTQVVVARRLRDVYGGDLLEPSNEAAMRAEIASGRDQGGRTGRAAERPTAQRAGPPGQRHSESGEAAGGRAAHSVGRVGPPAAYNWRDLAPWYATQSLDMLARGDVPLILTTSTLASISKA
ncbi:MAG: hypothetical protein LBK95_10665 [Bifidobacteriaceae bacterium]|nr:hypothetical protein [Bifidobacteriaceae bacterium]